MLIMETNTFLFTSTFFPPYHFGGDATHVYHLAQDLANRGHEVHIIHSLDSYYYKKGTAPVVNNYPLSENITVHSFKSPFNKFQSIFSYVFGVPFSFKSKFNQILKEVKPDVLHHHNIAGFGPWVFGLKAPFKMYTAHDHWLLCQMNGCLNFKNQLCYNPSNCMMCSVLSGRPPQLWRYTNYLKKKIKNLDVIISPSEYLKTRLENFGITIPITVIPNFVPEPNNPGPPLIKDSYFLFVGVLEKYKGIYELIEVFINLKSEMEDKLIIVGHGTEFNTINKLILKNNYNDRIILMGRVDESVLSNLYAYANAVVIPSIFFENCPMVALESIAHGTPIITSDVGGLPEITKKLTDKLIFKTPNHLKLILIDYKKNMGKNFKKSVFIMEIFKKKYSIATVDNYLNLIQRMRDFSGR